MRHTTDFPVGLNPEPPSVFGAKIFAERALRESTDLLNRFNKSTRRANHPKSPSSPSDKNILIFRIDKSVYIHRIPFHSEGRFANVTNVGWAAVDAAARETGVAKADDEVVLS